jgi:4-aminobutyrate aminotransferase-like enzyme
MKAEGLVEHCADVGRFALDRLEEMARRHPIIGSVRGRGCSWESSSSRTARRWHRM